MFLERCHSTSVVYVKMLEFGEVKTLMGSMGCEWGPFYSTQHSHWGTFRSAFPPRRLKSMVRLRNHENDDSS